MNDYRYAISLRAWHPTRPLDDLTTALGIVPTHSAIAGAPRTTPKGGPLSGVNRQSFWTGPLLEGSSADCGLAEALETILDQLSAKKALFVDLTASGGRIEFFIGWFLDGNSGDELDYKLLGRLADLTIDLSLDVYPPSAMSTGA